MPKGSLRAAEAARLAEDVIAEARLFALARELAGSSEDPAQVQKNQSSRLRRSKVRTPGAPQFVVQTMTGGQVANTMHFYSTPRVTDREAAEALVCDTLGLTSLTELPASRRRAAEELVDRLAAAEQPTGP